LKVNRRRSCGVQRNETGTRELFTAENAEVNVKRTLVVMKGYNFLRRFCELRS